MDDQITFTREHFNSVIENIVMMATVQASITLADALSLGIDNCSETKCPLTYVQINHMMQGALFTFREFEDKMRHQADATVGFANFVIDNPDLVEDMKDKFEEMKKDWRAGFDA